MTRRRLDEAKFFLGKMEAERAGQNWERFGFYLSAFINAARSVTWTFQSEDKTLYDSVRARWEGGHSPDERDLLKFMNERRLDAVKRTGVGFQHNTILVPVTFTGGLIPAVETLQIVVASETPGAGKVPTTGAILPRFAVGGEEVMPTCQRYVQMLEGLVDAGEGFG